MDRNIIKGHGVVSGTDAYSVVLSVADKSFLDKDMFFLEFTNANTGASTLDVNGIGSKALVRRDGSALSSGDIINGGFYFVQYDKDNDRYVLFGSVDTPFASESEAVAGTLTNKAISPDVLSKIRQKASHIFAVASGTDAYSVTLTPSPSAYVDGMTLIVRFQNANTSSGVTLDVNGLGARSVVKQGGDALGAGDIQQAVYILSYNGNTGKFELGGSITFASTSEVAAGTVSTKGISPKELAIGRQSNVHLFATISAAFGLSNYSGNLSPAITSYIDGAVYYFYISGSNTPTTIDLNGLGAKNVYRGDGRAIMEGDIQPQTVVAMAYSDFLPGGNTGFILLNDTTPYTTIFENAASFGDNGVTFRNNYGDNNNFSDEGAILSGRSNYLGAPTAENPQRSVILGGIGNVSAPAIYPNNAFTTVPNSIMFGTYGRMDRPDAFILSASGSGNPGSSMFSIIMLQSSGTSVDVTPHTISTVDGADTNGIPLYTTANSIITFQSYADAIINTGTYVGKIFSSVDVGVVKAVSGSATLVSQSNVFTVNETTGATTVLTNYAVEVVNNLLKFHFTNGNGYDITYHVTVYLSERRLSAP